MKYKHYCKRIQGINISKFVGIMISFCCTNFGYLNRSQQNLTQILSFLKMRIIKIAVVVCYIVLGSWCKHDGVSDFEHRGNRHKMAQHNSHTTSNKHGKFKDISRL